MIFSFAKNQPTNTKKLNLFINLISFIKIIVLMKAFFQNTYLKGFSTIKFIQLSYITFKNYLVKTTNSATSLS